MTITLMALITVNDTENDDDHDDDNDDDKSDFGGGFDDAGVLRPNI